MTSHSRIIVISSGFVDPAYMDRVREMAAQYDAELVVANEASKWSGNDIDKVWVEEGFELGQIDRFRIISSPKLEEPTMQRRTNKPRNVTPKRPGYYAGGEKELERGARLYTAPSKTNGYPLVQIHSKRFYDAHVELQQG